MSTSFSSLWYCLYRKCVTLFARVLIIVYGIVYTFFWVLCDILLIISRSFWHVELKHFVKLEVYKANFIITYCSNCKFSNTGRYRNTYRIILSMTLISNMHACMHSHLHFSTFVYFLFPQMRIFLMPLKEVVDND